MDTYIFDKRIMKKRFIKFGIIMLIIFPVLLAINYIFGDILPSWAYVLIDVVVGLLLFWGGSVLYDKIETKRMEKKLDKINAIRQREKEERIAKNNANKKEKTIVVASPKKKRKRRNRNKENLDGKTNEK